MGEMETSEEWREALNRLPSIGEEELKGIIQDLRSSSPSLNSFLEEPDSPLPSRDYGRRRVILASIDWPSESKAKIALIWEAIERIYREAEGKTFWQEELESLKTEFLGSDHQAEDLLDALLQTVNPVGKSDLELLQFPPGHPKNRTAYVGHPVLATVYYPFASFHRFLFEHKVSEAVRVLMALGAKSMLVEHVSGWSQEFAGNMNLPIPTVNGNASLSVSGKGVSKSNMLFRATLRGTESPSLPSDLVWYPHEAGWQQIVEGRMKYGLQDFCLTINYTEDFGVNANVNAQLLACQLGIGGSFQDFEETTWKIEGSFA